MSHCRGLPATCKHLAGRASEIPRLCVEPSNLYIYGRKSSVTAPSYSADVFGAQLISAGNASAASTVSVYSSTTPDSGSTTVLSVSAPTITPGGPAPSPLACPQDNGTIYTAGSGYGYMLECSIDRPV